MSHQSSFFKCSAVLATALLFSSWVRATEMIVSPTPAGSTTYTSSGTYTFQDIPKFNTQMNGPSATDGLTLILFTLTFNATPELKIVNDSAADLGVTPPGLAEPYVNASASFGASGPNPPASPAATATLTVLSGETLTDTIQSETTGSFSGTVDYKGEKPGDTGTIFLPAANSFEAQQVLTSSSDLSSYEGTGTYNLSALFHEGVATATGSTTSGDAGAPDVTFGALNELSASLQIDYVYFEVPNDDIPEPSSWSLMILSLAGLFLGRRFLVKRPTVS